MVISLSSALPTGLLCFAPFPLLGLPPNDFLCRMASHNALLYIFVSLAPQVLLSSPWLIALRALSSKAQKYFHYLLDCQVIYA
jgi:hypothetical protein